MGQRHALLDSAEFERRVREKRNPLVEWAWVVMADVALTLTPAAALPWYKLGALAFGVGTIAFWSARLIEMAYARYHAVPLEMYAAALARYAEQPRPLIRVDIVKRVSREANHELGMTPHFWGLRVSNDGAPATFEALLEVKAGMVGVGGRKRHISFSHSGETRARIATGAEDAFWFGRVYWHSLNKALGPKSLWFFHDQQQRDVEAFLQGVEPGTPDGQGGLWVTNPPEATADVEITITSDPQLLNGPWRRSYRFGPEKLIELPQLTPQIVVYPSSDSA